jgi:hypothetical protein
MSNGDGNVGRDCSVGCSNSRVVAVQTTPMRSAMDVVGIGQRRLSH